VRARVAWILAAAGLLVAAILFLARAGSDPRAGRPPREANAPSAAPTREGSGGGTDAAAQTAPPRAGEAPAGSGAADEGASRTLHGVVRGPDGPLRWAIVYLLPKNLRGVDDANAFRQGTRSESDGRWAMPNARPAGCWLGVVAEGHLPRFLDGDTLPPDPLDLALDTAPELEIAFGVNENLGMRQVHVRVTTAADVPAFRFPGPAAQPRKNLAATAETHEPLTVRVEGPGPYDVEIEGDRLYWEPATQRAQAPGRAFFLLLPSATIVVDLTDKETGEPFVDQGVLTAMDASGRSLSNGATGATRVLSQRVLPGAWDLEFRTPGYRPWRARSVRIEDADAEVRIEAALVRDPALGELRVRGITAAGAAVRRTGDTAWIQPHLERRGEGLTRLRGLDAGTVDALLWSEGGGLVVVLTGIDVPGGGVAEPKAVVIGGAYVEPATLGVEARSDLRVEADALGTLPFLVPGGALPAVGAAWPLAGGPVGRLGPFPHVPGLRLLERRGGGEIVHALPQSAIRPGR